MSALAEAPLAPSYANVCMLTSHSRKQLHSAAIRCVQGSTWKATVVTDQCGHAFTVKKEEQVCRVWPRRSPQSCRYWPPSQVIAPFLPPYFPSRSVPVVPCGGYALTPCPIRHFHRVLSLMHAHASIVLRKLFSAPCLLGIYTNSVARIPIPVGGGDV